MGIIADGLALRDGYEELFPTELRYVNKKDLFQKDAVPYVYITSDFQNTLYIFDVTNCIMNHLRVIPQGFLSDDTLYTFGFSDLEGNIVIMTETISNGETTPYAFYINKEDILKYMQPCQFEESQ